MIENTYLLFVDAADDAACYPAKNLISMTCAANATLLLHFKSSVGGSTGAESDTVTLTITADSEKDIMKKIAHHITNGEGGVIQIANDVSSTYFDTKITACSITLDT